VEDYVRRYLRIISLLLGLGLLLYWAVPSQSKPGASDAIKKRGYLLWGSDAEGGAPYIFPDPKDPSRLIGFEVDIADAIARELGVKAKQSQNAWDSLIPGLQRGDYDIAMNGIEITSQREQEVLFSIPYYIYTEQLVVRKEDTAIQTANDLKGKKVGTLSGTVAQDILTKIGGVDVKIYPGQVEPYEDLAIGRIDAVLLDLPIAAYYGKSNPKLKYAGTPMGEGFYAIAVRKGDADLQKAIDEILVKLLKSGELKKIYEKWDLWNESQEKLSKNVKDSSGHSGIEESKKAPVHTFFPMLFKGAGLTIFISATAMALAITLGLLLAVARLYSRAPLSNIAVAYIPEEIFANPKAERTKTFLSRVLKI
jgi:polar amino acid transport system substrate-binding protein